MLRAMPPPAPSPARFSSAAGPWVLLLVGYLTLQVLVRLAAGEALELDEAEQVLWAQQLALGYGTQPPLYTWLQRGVFEVLGVSVLSLALLKNGLLALTYLFTFAAARRLMPTPLAALASASMLLIPQIGWESQRDLTHSVVCTTLAAATWWAVVALRERATPSRFALLGVALGLGVLGKYSFAAFALAVGIALATAASTRVLVFQRGMLLALLVAGLVVAPHAVWLAANLAQATGGTLSKMGATSTLGWAPGVARGLGSLALTVIAFLTPLWIVLAALFVRRGWRDGIVPGPACGLFRRHLAAVAALLVAMVLAGAVTQFKDRWLQPFLFIAPVAFFACAPHLLHHPRLPLLRRVLAVWAVLLLALMAARVPFNGWRGQPDEMNVPARGLVWALREAGYDGRTIVSSDRVLAGVLRLQFAPARVVVVGRGGDPVPNGPSLWIGSGDAAAALGPIEDATGAAAASAHTLDLPATWAPASAPPLRYTFSLQPSG
jgi:4-amino-4-deoxy-L-arabinose transferase-like glycosyltransferase